MKLRLHRKHTIRRGRGNDMVITIPMEFGQFVREDREVLTYIGENDTLVLSVGELESMKRYDKNSRTLRKIVKKGETVGYLMGLPFSFAERNGLTYGDSLVGYMSGPLLLIASENMPSEKVGPEYSEVESA